MIYPFHIVSPNIFKNVFKILLKLHYHRCSTNLTKSSRWQCNRSLNYFNKTLNNSWDAL